MLPAKQSPWTSSGPTSELQSIELDCNGINHKHSWSSHSVGFRWWLKNLFKQVENTLIFYPLTLNGSAFEEETELKQRWVQFLADNALKCYSLFKKSWGHSVFQDILWLFLNYTLCIKYKSNRNMHPTHLVEINTFSGLLNVHEFTIFLIEKPNSIHYYYYYL